MVTPKYVHVTLDTDQLNDSVLYSISREDRVFTIGYSEIIMHIFQG